MSTSETKHQQRLVEIVDKSPWFMGALAAVRQLALPEWCIGAGAIRNLVWDSLHGKSSPSQLSDVDVAYFDAADTSPQRDNELQGRLQALSPSVPWEVTNQAGVHQWFEEHFGHAVEPLRSLEEAVASWPEFATTVGISLRQDNSLQVIAPHGLEDLFAIIVRRNPTRVGADLRGQTPLFCSRMVIRRLASEARLNQRLQRTSAAQRSFAPRPPLIRGVVR